MREIRENWIPGASYRWIGVLAACLAAVAMAPTLPAREQVVIQKGTNGNTQLRAGDGWLDQQNPTTNHAGSTTLQVRARTGRRQRALLLFDLSLVPNAGIKTATLTLNVVQPPSANRTYVANFISSFWDQASVTWNDRVGTTPWGAAGGDFNNGVGNGTDTAGVTTASTSVTWNLTTAARVWYNSSANYGILIHDNTETGGGAGIQTIFSSMNDATPANRPQLTLTFLQNVSNLKATPGNAAITVSWSYPTPIGTILEPYAGVVILRRQGVPIDKSSHPADGSAPPALCSAVGSGTVVFVGTMADTSFSDDSSDACGGPTNGQPSYYKVFTYDTAFNYSSDPTGLGAPLDGGSTYTAEAGAMPNPPGSTQSPLWMIATHSSNLAPPGIVPASQIDIGTDTNQIFALDANTGAHLYPPVSLGGVITGRPPILDAVDASIGKQVAYVACRDNYVYAVDTLTGQILWQADPSNSTTNLFQGGAAVQIKSFSSALFLPSHDLVVVGTRNGGTTTANRIIGIDGNTGTTVWTRTGNSGGTPPMDIISSTPAVDYVHNAIWVTSHANNGSTQPNLWKLDPSTGAVLFSTNLPGGNIDSSPSFSYSSDVLFVATNGVTGGGTPANGRIYALNPITGGAVSGATVAFFDGADGAVRGFPFVVNAAPPYTVVFTTATMVHAVSFDPVTNTFTPLWTSAALNSPSAPVVSTTLNEVYVGTADGYLNELNLADGTVSKRVVVNTFYPAIVGDPALDDTNHRVYVSTVTNDQRAYGFAVPF
jgi:PQQ-like domain/Disaggregatase related repeat